MPELAKAYVQIIPSAEGIQGNLTKIMDGEAEAAGKSAGKKFSSVFGSVAKAGLATVGALAGAAVSASGAMLKGVSNVADYGDNIDKMSQKMGLSAEAFQEWDAIMRHSGTTIETMQSGMRTLANAVETGNKAFDRIGLTQEQIASMSNEDLFAATITALQNVENETERTYLAGQLLGRGATELGALLNTSAEDTQAMRDRVHELGGVMGDDAVKAAAAYTDSLQDMQTAFSSISRGFLSEFLPGITTAMDGLTAIFSGDSESGLALIREGITSVVDTISNILPDLIQLGSEIIVTLVTAITDNLPLLLKSAGEAILTISSGLIENLPEIIKTGLDVIISLALGIANALPDLIPTIVDVVLEIVDTLTDPETLGLLVDASIAIIVALAVGLIDAIPRLIEKAPEIIQNLVTALVENVPKLFEAALKIITELVKGIKDNFYRLTKAGWEIVQTLLDGIGDIFTKMLDIGSNIVSGIWQGISNGYTWITNKISGWVGDVVGFFKRILGIASPSKVFAQMGGFVAEGFGLGIEDNLGAVESAVGDMSDAAINAWKADSLTTAINGSAAYSFSGAGNTVDEAMGLATAIKSALEGVGVYMDGHMVGKLVTRTQANMARAYG